MRRPCFTTGKATDPYGLGATVTLLNPVAPVEFFVSDQGYLITLDNWHNMGYGKVLALYGPDGAPIKSYELKDLFSEEEISRFEHSVSSIGAQRTCLRRRGSEGVVHQSRRQGNRSHHGCHAGDLPVVQMAGPGSRKRFRLQILKRRQAVAAVLAVPVTRRAVRPL